MKAYAVTNKETLQTVYLGLHEDLDAAWTVFLGWPDDAEQADAKLKFCCEEVDVYPTAQKCRIDGRE